MKKLTKNTATTMFGAVATSAMWYARCLNKGVSHLIHSIYLSGTHKCFAFFVRVTA